MSLHKTKKKSVFGFTFQEISLIKRAFSYLKPYKFVAIIIFILTIAASLFELIPVYIQKQIIDEAITNKNINLLIMLSIAAIMVPIVQIIMTSISKYLSAKVSLKMSQRARQDLMDHIQKLGLSFFNKHSSGDLLSRGITDAEKISKFNIDIPTTVIYQTVILTASFIACARYEWWLALLNIFIYSLEYFPTKKAGKGISERSKQIRNIDSRATKTLHESLNGIKTIQLFCREKLHYHEYKNSMNEYAHKSVKLAAYFGKISVTNEFFRALGSIISWGVLGYYVYIGKYSVGTLWMLTFYLRFMSAPFRAITFSIYLRFKEQIPYLSRFFEYLDTEPEIKEDKNVVNTSTLKGDIYFDKIAFNYGNASNKFDDPILFDLTFKIKSRSSVAFVGPSGGGKSTITKLIARYYDVEQGAIYIDGTDIKKYALKELRNRVGTVFQDTYLFNATIRENLQIAKYNASDYELEEATKIAQIYDFILDLPNGFDTLVGERGIKLSGGQRQRMSIARLLLYDPDILIFDEATSSLDSETEKALTQAMDNQLAKKTRITVAHRLSTIVNADQIFVIDQGKVVEQGTHEELLSHCGTYEKLYNVMESVGSKEVHA